MEGSDKGQSASPAGAAGEVKDRPLAEEGVELEVAEGWHLQTSRLHHRVTKLEPEEGAFRVSHSHQSSRTFFLLSARRF